ncbi:MAG TPA: UDP-N-acetylmuramoyl-tripeptide--D-alanyl-D-alanine ligase [Steroidobacteraceae bacterium]|nr:UDP-N-acetylmuramoyl-tripeptide--D-alanyl-D-alanine ligase [Steroidobacteraceae bacterium]
MTALEFIARAGARISTSTTRRRASDLFGRYCSFCARVVLRIRKPLIIGVTGSAGKTTTVHMIAAVLRHPAARQIVGAVAHSVHNMNDDNGLPLTVLRYEHWIEWHNLWEVPLLLPRALWLAFFARYPRVLVLEYGTHWRGHLHHLVEVAPPNIGIVTTIGPAHLDRLKTLQGVVREKSAIVKTVPASGLIVLGADHDYVADLEAQAKGQVVKLPGRGADLARGIARVVALHLGVPKQAIEAALADVRPMESRLNELQLGDMTIIDDSYNANPVSMRLGLDRLAQAAQPVQRRIAFLGSMGELGDEATQYHRQIGVYAHEKADVVIGVGELARHYDPDHWFADSGECARQVNRLVGPGDCVLVKGSHSVHMHAIVERLRAVPS